MLGCGWVNFTFPKLENVVLLVSLLVHACFGSWVKVAWDEMRL